MMDGLNRRVSMMVRGGALAIVFVTSTWSLFAIAQQPELSNPNTKITTDPEEIERLDRAAQEDAKRKAEEGEKDIYPEARESKTPILKAPALPTEPMKLEYALKAPLRYLVRGKHRAAVKGREDMRQIYTSSLLVTYAPMAPDAPLPAMAWMAPSLESAPGGDKEGGARVLVSVEQAYGTFEEPPLLGDIERTHQILRQAVFSYVLRPTGKVTDVRIHEPTNPLSKFSMAQLVTAAENLQPVFPEEPVGPGSTWTQKFQYRDERGEVVFNEDASNVYKLEEWRPCRTGVCAYITIEQKMNASARLSSPGMRTDAASSGGGEGFMLFDPHTGQVVKTQWKIKGQGFTKAYATKDGKDSQLVDAEVLVDVEFTTERIEEETP
ncbi:MAG: hypothetical protein AAGI01_01930 [Myxococcota bacterium]